MLYLFECAVFLEQQKSKKELVQKDVNILPFPSVKPQHGFVGLNFLRSSLNCLNHPTQSISFSAWSNVALMAICAATDSCDIFIYYCAALYSATATCAVILDTREGASPHPKKNL